MGIEVHADNFESEVLQSNIPVLVDFWGPQCGPCLALKPEVEKLYKRYNDRFKLVEVDASKNKRLCLNLRVLGLPTFLIYKNGEEMARLKGGELQVAEIEEALKEVLD